METKWKYAVILVGAGTTIGILNPEKAFIAFVSTWLFIIPAVVAIYLMYGLKQYLGDRKNKTIKNNDIATRSISTIRQEEGLKEEKNVLYTQKNVTK